MEIYTIGHSNVPLPRFLAAIATHGITLVVDVRSHPYSRFAPWANARELPVELLKATIDYRFLGDALGGRPKDPKLRAADGSPDYAKMSSSAAYLKGIAEVLDAAGRERVALLCSEADPRRCHRELLLGVTLRERGCTVRHILLDGSLLSEQGRTEL